MGWTRLGTVRGCLLAVYTLLFVACFANVGLSLYYLSALALDSFQTSAVFLGALLTGFVLLVCSVWGCHRTEDVRSHSNNVSRIAFTLIYIGLLTCFIAWTVCTKQTYDLIAETVSEPFEYWATHLGPESKMLYNFAIEFEDMWESGHCEGNHCLYEDCRGSPQVLTTPLECVDEGMTAQFNFWKSKYTGSADDLRSCLSIVNDIKNKTGDLDVPTVTWCQSRDLFLESARTVNGVMFGITLGQAACILISIILMYYYMFLVETEFPERKRGRACSVIRRTLTDGWLQSLRSEDEDKDVSQKKKPPEAKPTI